MSEHPMMTAYLSEARWFAGKGRDHDVVQTRRIATLPGPPVVTIEIVTVEYADGGRELYQMPLAHYPEPQERIGHALVGPHTDDELGAVFSYDAVHDREAMAVYLRAFAATPPGEQADVGGLVFHRVAEHELDLESHSTLFSGEQSNSSVAFGDDSLLKVFRKVTPGRNPDIEIHRALTLADSPHVAALYGWAETEGESTDERLDLAMIQQFLRTAADGWALALASVRSLYADAVTDPGADQLPDLGMGGPPAAPVEVAEAEDSGDALLVDPARAGGDFAGESERLGVAVAEVHEVLREEFPVENGPGGQGLSAEELADTMTARLDDQLRALGEHAGPLEAHAAAVRALYDRLRGLDAAIPVQRVHGDLHLGQTLRVVHHWKLVDFEGEPARPLADRVLPDSPWRDVAGMLRSFDYAARSVERDTTSDLLDQGRGGDGGPGDDADRDREALTALAQAWATRNRDAFLSGYTGGEGLSDDARALVAAYEADKAVYEVGYEARNRPTWLEIPLAALARLSTGTAAGPEETP